MSETVTEAVEETKTEAKTYSEEQFKGLLADKQAEVKKRQAIETELAELKAKRNPALTRLVLDHQLPAPSLSR